MTKRVIILKGLQGSGKTTWAKEQQQLHPSMWVRVNKDDLRAMLHNKQHSDHNEAFVLALRDHIILEALKDGKHLLIDDTNFNPVHEKQIRELVAGLAVVEVKFFDVPLEVCLERNRIRPNSVPEDVIRAMYKKYIAHKTPRPDRVPELDPTLPQGKVFDLDGTLALVGWRNPYAAELCEQDPVNTPVLEVLLDAWEKKETIILVSGRREMHRWQTEQWLSHNRIPYDVLFMRVNGDNRKDYIVKQEIYEQHIKGKYAVTCIYDDRDQTVKMWRDLGLTVFQVADGDY